MISSSQTCSKFRMKYRRLLCRALLGRIEKARAFNVAHKPTENLTAYDCYLRGSYLQKNLTLDDLLEAKANFEKAIELDKNFAAAYSRLASIYLTLVFILEIHTDGSEVRGHRGTCSAS